MEKIELIDFKDSKLLKIGIITSIIIIFLWLIPLFIFNYLPSADRGNYGDIYGIVNSLFSGLALAGIILTILLQRNELALQRQELKDTREELKRTANAQENSEKALNRQAENLKISAKLSALNTLVGFYSELEHNIRKGITNPGSNLPDVIRKKNEYVQRIEDILERKEPLI
jgi:signal transduction histidine kinase